MSKISAADVKRARVTIDLDGEEVTLIPSPLAIMTLSDPEEGFEPIFKALGKGSFQVMARVVAAGLGLEGKAARDLLNKVAVLDIEEQAKIIKFATICRNGGHLLQIEDASDENPPGGS